ncbi:MAG: molybdopterin biosynthesis protein, partial [Paracoccaceae bacterium]
MIGLLGFLAIWGLGLWRGWRRALIWGLAALWWLAVIGAHLPWFGQPRLAALVGGTFEAWLVVGLLAAMIMLYSLVFSAVKARAAVPAAAAAPAPTPGTFAEAELSRYARHI